MARVRTLLRLLLVCVGLLVLLGIGAFLFLDHGAKLAVEKGVSSALAVPVTADSVSIKPFAGSVALAGLSVSNPPGFSQSPFLDLRAASLQVTLGSLMKDVVEVPRLELSGIHLRLEGRGTKTNYGALLEHLDGGEPKEPKKEPKPGGGEGKRFLIRELVIRDVTVDADYALEGSLKKLSGAQATATLPELTLKDIGNGEGLTIRQLSARILRALLEAAGSGKLPGLSADLSENLKKSLSDYGARAERLKSEVGGALEGVKDLFKKGK